MELLVSSEKASDGVHGETRMESRIRPKAAWMSESPIIVPAQPSCLVPVAVVMIKKQFAEPGKLAL